MEGVREGVGDGGEEREGRETIRTTSKDCGYCCNRHISVIAFLTQYNVLKLETESRIV